MAEYSPMMQHYLELKEKYKDCLIFYRLGDFYEMFFDDAVTASRELELTLTGRDCGQEERAPMCGVPYHSAETYISRLIAKGYKVAICEQLEDPKKAAGIVKRDVIRVVTPGTVVESNMLDEKKNNYIMSIFKKGIFFGIAICDISTGDFYASEIKENNNFVKLLDEIARFSPAEIVVNSMLYDSTEEISKIKERFDIFISKQREEAFTENYDTLSDNYTLVKEDGKPIENYNNQLFAISAINGLIEYLNQTQKIKLEHINTIHFYAISRYMSLDISARRNLEITEKMRDKSKKGTLLWVLDKTSTAMGGRLLRRWLNDPLIDVNEINQRLNAVKELKDNIIFRGDVIEKLKKVYDIERLIGKISYGNANARDMISLKNSIKQLPDLKLLLKSVKSEFLIELYDHLDELNDLYNLIETAIVDDPPMTIKEGGIIKLGYNEDVDRYKKATTEGKQWIINIETEEKEKTGIKNLKVGYTKVFGYYLEVTRSYLNLVPDRYIRKQTLTNCERYITEELKKVEDEIIGAEEKVVALEYDLFTELRKKISNEIERIQLSATVISTLDVLCSFATIAEELNYVMPIVDNSGEIDIQAGRHPVIEKMLPSGSFVQNDTFLNKDADRLSIITGPNMAGKSTYMRQVALITLMAQVRKFCPCKLCKDWSCR